MVTLRRNSWPVLLFVILIFFSSSLAVWSQKEQDQILLRNGEQISGRLNYADTSSVHFNAKTIQRAGVVEIRFAGATVAAPATHVEDQVVMRDGRILIGNVSQISSSLVFQNSNQLKRSQVALIKFANDRLAPIETNPPVETKPPAEDKPDKEPTASPDPGIAAGRKPGDEIPGGDKSDDKSSRGKSKTPWFDDNPDCARVDIAYASIGGDPYKYDRAGKMLEPHPPGYVTCTVTYFVCSDKFMQQKVINTNAGEKCPEVTIRACKVCCSAWREAQKSETGCKPLNDADCDGIANENDDTPLEAINCSDKKVPGKQ